MGGDGQLQRYRGGCGNASAGSEMRFLTPLEVERVEDVSADGRGTWVLLAPLKFESDAIGPGAVPEGFITDFASVPRVPVAFLLFGDLAQAAAVVHDWLYTVHRTDRATADAVFKEGLSACGVSAWRAWFMWLGVRLGGAHAWDADGAPQFDRVRAQINAGGAL